MERPLATVAIISHERPALRDRATESALRSVACSGDDLPVIIIDSSRHLRPPVHGANVLHRPDLPDCISKRRLAMELGETEWVVMLDDDCQSVPEAVSTMLAAMRSDEHRGTAALFAATGFAGPRNWIFRTALHSDLIEGFNEVKGGEVAWGVTTMSAFRRQPTLAADAFRRENLRSPVGGEDVDACIRLRAAGWLLCQLAGTLALHDSQTWNSFGKNARRLYNYGQGEGELIRMHPAHSKAGYENLLVSAGFAMLCARAVGGRPQTWRSASLATLTGWYAGELARLRAQNREAAGAELLVQAMWSAAYELGRLRTAVARRAPRLALRRFNWEAPEPTGFSRALSAEAAKRLAVTGVSAAATVVILRAIRRRQ